MAAYVSGHASPEQVEELTHLLREDDQALDYYLEYLDLHAGLAVDDAPWSDVSPTCASYVSGSHEFPAAGKAAEGKSAACKWAMTAVAAGLVAALLLAGMLVVKNRSTAPDDSGTKRDDYLAVMTDASDAVWKTGSHVPRDVGEAVGRVPVELVSGRAEFQFDSGARVAIAGPALLEFLSRNRARLHRGRLTALVAESARGFTVEFDGAEVVDQGTEFALNCEDPSTAEVHVFDGEVLVRPDRRPGRSSLRLAANDTKRVLIGPGLIEDALFETERFLRIDREAGVPETNGDVRYLHRPPRSVLQGVFEHNEYILVFRERANSILSEAVQVNAIGPGVYRTKRQPEDPPGTAVAVPVDQPDRETLHTLARGTRVSSYFVHFDPVRGGGAKGVHRKGSIRFEQPVLGVIIATRHLVPSDAMLGHPGTRYETTDFAIARNGLEPDDRMTLSEDRRTVHLQLGAGTSVDHVRILVAHDGPHHRESP
jgi:hypothetical protein